MIGVGCFNSVPIDHGRWLPDKGYNRAFVVAELQRSPQSFDGNIVEEPALAVYRDTRVRTPQLIRPCK